MTKGLGEIRKLKIAELLDHGAMLDNDGTPLFLPASDLSKEAAEGDEVEVFIFVNKSNEPEATVKLPLFPVGGVGLVEITGVRNNIAYANIGTKRDVVIPAKEQMRLPFPGQKVLMTLQRNAKTNNLYGSTRILASLRNNNIKYERGDKVKALIFDKMEIGRRVLVDDQFVGILIEKEIYTGVRNGDTVSAYVREVKGKDIYLSMHKEGRERIEEACDIIMKFLENHNGYARLSDNSPPDEIQLRLKMSKKTFKQACGQLFKANKILITKRGIKLNKK